MNHITHHESCGCAEKKIMELEKEIVRLKKIISDRSCCCSGCTKHNLALENSVSNGEFEGE